MEEQKQAAPTAPVEPLVSTPIYVASRASVPERPAMWQRLRDEEGWNITATWIDEAGDQETADFSELWERIENEIIHSEGVLLYAEGSDFPLKGALVEAGLALGMGKRVAIVLSDCELNGRTLRPIGSWVKHPRCQFFETLEDAHAWLAC